MTKRTLDELNVIDDFLFQSMMIRDKKGEEFCRILLKTILNKDFKNIKVSVQKSTPGKDTDKHGIRLDAYIEAFPENVPTASVEMSSGKSVIENAEILSDVYNIEPNTYKDGSEARRTRYYHSLIDTNLLKSGIPYNKLQNVVIIMILPSDPFGKNRMVYTIKNECLEDSSIEYDDGNLTIYLYTKGTVGTPRKELKDMLQYLEHSTEENIKNKDIELIHRLATEVKQDAKVGIEFMKSWEREYISRHEGQKEGQTRTLSELIIKKIKKNLSLSEIAEHLEKDEVTLRPIYEVIIKHAPDYDMDKILDELCPYRNWN